MRFTYTADIDQQKVKNFLKRHHVSRKLLAKVKFDGGQILVNQVEQNAIFRLSVGDEVAIITPDEAANPELIPEDAPLDIAYEDEDYLLVNKPAATPSITGVNAPTGSMCNYVAAYLIRQHYANQRVHLATRLDRDTSGLMVFAKHSFAHSILRAAQEDAAYEKHYYALVKFDENLPVSGEIDAPIGRREGSIIERCVRFDGQLESKAARTSYKVVQRVDGLALLDLHLHTGRTHQIRVHMAYLGYPLLGDNLYGGDCSLIQRQALHCRAVRFDNIFRGKKIEVTSELPADMAKLLKKM